jgi:hypothetical protein
VIATACIATSLPPEAFGVPASERLGAVMLSVLHEQWEEQRNAAKLDRLGNR